MKKSIKKILALLLACMLVASFAACNNNPDTSGEPSGSTTSPSSQPSGSSEQPSTEPGRTTLNVAVSLDSGTLDPLGMTGAGGFLNVERTYMETLYDYDANGERFWILATGMDYISDIHYTLHIREGVTFSNGNTMDANDVLYTMVKNNESPQFYLNVKAIDFEKTNVADDYTIDLWYTAFNASQEIGMSQMVILDEESYDPEEMSLNPVGTGPYIVTDYVVNSHVKVELRDDYWGDTPSITTINFKTLNEDSQRVNALVTGDVDMAAIPIKDADYIESLGDYTVTIRNQGSYFVTLFNMTPDAPLGTAEARQAVSYAIERQAIADIVFSGKADVLRWPVSESLIDIEDRFLDMDETYSAGYDTAKAQTLADESGLTGKTLRIITNGAADYITMAEIIQDSLSAIGVNSDIINYDQATYFGLLMDESNFDIAIFTPTAPSMLAVDILYNYPTFIPLGWTGEKHDEYMTFGAAATETFDMTARGDILYDMLKIFVEEVPWYGICEWPVVNVFNSDMQDVTFTLAGSALYQFYSFAS